VIAHTTGVPTVAPRKVPLLLGVGMSWLPSAGECANVPIASILSLQIPDTACAMRMRGFSTIIHCRMRRFEFVRSSQERPGRREKSNARLCRGRGEVGRSSDRTLSDRETASGYQSRQGNGGSKGGSGGAGYSWTKLGLAEGRDEMRRVAPRLHGQEAPARGISLCATGVIQ
jgi:hypothetical protein